MLRACNHRGLILMEVITTLILIGVIGVFTGMFLYTGVSGFITSKKISETALKTQNALNRIDVELRDMIQVASVPVPVFTNNSITYRTTSSDLPGTREIRFEPDPGRLTLRVNGTPYLLLDGVESFTVGTEQMDLDNENSDEELTAINLSLRMADVGTVFTKKIYPRSPNFINMP